MLLSRALPDLSPRPFLLLVLGVSVVHLRFLGRSRGCPTYAQPAATAATSSPRCAAAACSREARLEPARARTAPASAIPAPTRKALWKPSVSATTTGLPAAAGWSGGLFATVARIARPSAPPICCDVLISPDAKPASCGSTPLTAATVLDTKARPRPGAPGSDANKTSPTYEPWASTCENQSKPPAVMTSPVTSTALKPKR